MTHEPNDEVQRLDAAIVATEARLTRQFDTLMTRDSEGEETSSAERHVASLAGELDRLRALRTRLLSDQKGEA